MAGRCSQMLAFTLVVNTNIAIIIAFATPYWYVKQATNENKGIWAFCEANGCNWVFENDFRLEKQQTDWFKAVQGAMSVGLALGLIALLVTTLSLCCTCHTCNPHHTISGLMLTSSVAMTVGIILFGVKANDDWNIEIEKNIIGFFGWSFWVGVGAAALALLTSFVYCCMGRNDRR